MENPNTKIEYFILSPDGFATFPEPFTTTLGDFTEDIQRRLKEFKARFQHQGYYSSNNGRIELDHLENYMYAKLLTDIYRYRLKSTGHNSEKYGNCEVCNKHCSEVFLQVEEKAYIIDNEICFTEHGCKSLVGHKECLISARK